MKTPSSARPGVWWIYVASMVLAGVAAAVSLAAGANGDVRTVGLLAVLVGSVGALLVLIFAPHRVSRERREKE